MFCLPGTVLGMFCLPLLASGGIMGVFIAAILWIAISRTPAEKPGPLPDHLPDGTELENCDRCGRPLEKRQWVSGLCRRCEAESEEDVGGPIWRLGQ